MMARSSIRIGLFRPALRLLFLTLLVLIANVASFAEASGFMQWSRPKHTAAGTSANTFASVAGINVINYVSVEGASADGSGGTPQPYTDIVDAQSGDLMQRVRQNHFYDTDVVLVPTETTKGYFTCQPLYIHPGEGNLATQPTWCGVLQFCKRDASAGMQIVLPNTTIIPLLPGDTAGAQLPWECSPEFPCVVRTQELRTGQLGGCQRRANSSATHTGLNDLGPLPKSPPQSTHVTIAWKDQLFMFRPLVIASARDAETALGLINTVPRPVWTVTPERIDYVMQYLTIAYPLGADKRSAPEGPFVKQWAMCAMILLYENGTIVMFDSDRDRSHAQHILPTGLMYFTTSDLPKPVPHCVPYVETVLKLMPCFESNRTVHAALYSSTFALTCASGVGFLMDFVISEPGVYPGNVSHIGTFPIPDSFNVSNLVPGVPLRTDITFVLVQPYIDIRDWVYYENSEQFSPFFSYTVSIAISRIEHNNFVAGGGVDPTAPSFLTLLYTSAVSTRRKVCPWMTQNLIGVNVLTNFNTTLYGRELQNITNSIGWVSTASIPADQMLTMPDRSLLSQKMMEATSRVARWVASEGLAYSVVTEDLHLLINGSSGAIIKPSEFYIDENNDAHGGVKSASPVRTNPFSNASSVSPILVWDKPPPTATGIDRTENSLSSTFVLITSPSVEADRDGFDIDRLVCSYTLNSHGGITTSFVQVTLEENTSHTLTWLPIPSLAVLYSPYTENFCTSALADPTQTRVTVVPAMTLLIMIQQDSYNNTNDFSRVISNPLRTAIAATTPLSYQLSTPLNLVNDRVVALNPVGSIMTYICAYHTLRAYYAVVGNESWYLDLNSLPWCKTPGLQCMCPNDSIFLTISADRSFLFVNVVAEIWVDDYPFNLMGVLAVKADSGEVIQFYDPDFFAQNSDQCTQNPPTHTPFGPVTELDVSSVGAMPSNGMSVLLWAGAVTMLNSRCFVMLSISGFGDSTSTFQHEGLYAPFSDSYSFIHSTALPRHVNGSTSRVLVTNPRHLSRINRVWSARSARGRGYSSSGTTQASSAPSTYTFYTFVVTILYFRGTWAEFDNDIVIEGDSLFLTDTPIHDIASYGASVYCFSVTQALTLSLSGQNVSGMLPTFAANNVLDSVSINSMWYAVQVLPQRIKSEAIVGLYAYQTSAVSNAIGFAYVAYYSSNDTGLDGILNGIGVFSVPRPTVPKVCVAASNVTCFDATSSLSKPSVAYAGNGTEYYGRPAVNYLGLMVFTVPDTPCNALIYGALDEVPRVAWSSPTWVGQDNGVDMNIDPTMCGDAVLSDEGLLLMCRSSQHTGGSTTLYQRMYLLRSSTGQVLLAYGPSTRQGTTTFSDSGSLITYVNTFSTAITLELVGDTLVVPYTIRNGFCLSDGFASYFLDFSSDGNVVVATKMPWDLAVNHTVISANVNTLPRVFPLSAKQFHGYSGLRLGKSFVLERSTELIVYLSPALPTSLIIGTMNFLRGSTTFMTDPAFSINIVGAESCARCDALSCPEFCAFSLVTGVQLKYVMIVGLNSFHLWTKNTTNSITWIDTGRNEYIPFAGNASLAVARHQFQLQSRQQVFMCPSDAVPSPEPTFLSEPTRYCMVVPDLTGRRWASIEVSPNSTFATVTSFSTAGFNADNYYTYRQAIMTTPVFQVGTTPAMTYLLTNALYMNAFPNELSNGEVLTSIGRVTLFPAVLRVFPPSLDDYFQLDSMTCIDMDTQIPLCSDRFVYFNPDTDMMPSVQSVVWRGLPGNWGSGFITVGFEVHLSDIMRESLQDPPQVCGTGSSNVCPSICQPTAHCVSQATSYLNHYFYTYTMLPAHSSVVVPAALNAACGGEANGTQPFTGSTLLGGPLGDDELGAPIYNKFYCTKDNTVVLTIRVGDRDVITQSFPVGAPSEAYPGFEFTCSDCTFFILYGVIAQPLEWIAAGAIKSLVITVLFYFFLEKIRKNHRYQTRAKNRHKHHSKKLEALLLRLREHELLNCSTTSQAAGEENVASPTLASIDLAKLGLSSTNNTPHSPLPLQERAVLFPGYKAQPLAYLTAEERAVEKKLLLREIARVREQVREDEEYEYNHERKRWAISRWLPNPITVYSTLVIRLSGIRHPEERRTMLSRVQDGLSTKHVTKRQLVDMLANITGESQCERHVVESFAHFYQWNMCLNRQVVVREFIDESAHLAAPGVIDIMEASLQAVHDRLREAYVLFRLAFVDKKMNGNSGMFAGAGGIGRRRNSDNDSTVAYLYAGDGAAVPIDDVANPNALSESHPSDFTDIAAEQTPMRHGSALGSSATPLAGYGLDTTGGRAINASIPASAPLLAPNAGGNAKGRYLGARRTSGLNGGSIAEERRPDSIALKAQQQPQPSTPALNGSGDYSGMMGFNPYFGIGGPPALGQGGTPILGNSKGSPAIHPQLSISSPAMHGVLSSPYGAPAVATPGMGPADGFSLYGTPPMVGPNGLGAGEQQKKGFKPPEFDLRARGANFLKNTKQMYYADKGENVYDEEDEAIARRAEQGQGSGEGNINDANSDDLVSPRPNNSSRNTFGGNTRKSYGMRSNSVLGGGAFDSHVNSMVHASRGVGPQDFKGMDGVQRGGADGNSVRNRDARGASTGAAGTSGRKVGRYMSSLGRFDDNTSMATDPRPDGGSRREHTDGQQQRAVGPPQQARTGRTASVLQQPQPSQQLQSSSFASALLKKISRLDRPIDDDDNDYSGKGSGSEHSGSHSSKASQPLLGDSSFGFVDVGEIDAEEWEHYKYTVAAQTLKGEVDAFVEMISTHAHCFEYAALPSRSIDDKLMPNTLLIIASIVQTLVTLLIYAVDVLRRSGARSEGNLSAFEVYQCIFFMMFNSSGPSALLVSVMARADLGALEHSQTFKTKFRDLFSDPYVVFVLTVFCFPIATHILPGMFLFGWMMLPALSITIVFEYYLRTRLSVQTRFAIAVRFLSRVVVLFVVAVVFSLSFNYSASYVWSTSEGYLYSGSYRQATYFDIIANDYWSRSLTCFYEHITMTISNFFQMGLLTSFL